MQITLQVASVMKTGASASNSGKLQETIRLCAPKSTPQTSGMIVPQGTTMSFQVTDPTQMGQFTADQLVTVTMAPVAPAS